MKDKLLDLDKKIKRLLEEKDGYPQDGLYHYTDLSGLEGILSTRKLWLTHYSSLKDQSEIKHAHQVAIELIENHKRSSNHQSFWNSYLEKVKDVFELGDYFICSFSSSHDNPKLWNEYAKCEGVAIKFRKEYFTPTVNMNKKKKRYNYATIQYISYKTDEFKARLVQLVQSVDRILEDGDHDLYAELKARLTTYLLTYMPTLKEKGFSDEQECRLYQFGFKSEMNVKGEKHKRIFAIPQVERNGKIVLLRRFKQKDVSEIILSKTDSQEWLKRLLYENQFTGVKIRYR